MLAELALESRNDTDLFRQNLLLGQAKSVLHVTSSHVAIEEDCTKEKESVTIYRRDR